MNLPSTQSSFERCFRLWPRVLVVGLALAAFLAVASAEEPMPTAAPENAREARLDRAGDVWSVEVDRQRVHHGNDFLAALRVAAAGLTPGRTWRESILVYNDAKIGPGAEAGRDGLRAFDVPSLTTLDFRGNTLDVYDAAGASIIPLRMRNVSHVEIRRLRMTGTPRFAALIKGCHDVKLAEVSLSLRGRASPDRRGGGIRSEGGDRAWSGRENTRITLSNVRVEHAGGHAVEMWRTDGLEIDTLTTRESGGCGLLLNQTRNARIGLVDAYRANRGGGYAGFRTANNAGPGIEVGKVIAVECGRGIFTVSGSRGIVVREVEIRGSTGHGILIEDTKDMEVKGGLIENCGAEGVRISSRSIGQGPGGPHHPASNVTVRNLRVSGCSFGVHESLPRTHENFILNNDLRGNRICLSSHGEGTVVEGNRCE